MNLHKKIEMTPLIVMVCTYSLRERNKWKDKFEEWIDRSKRLLHCKIHGYGSMEELLPRRRPHALQVVGDPQASLPQRLVQRVHHVLRRHVRRRAIQRPPRLRVRCHQHFLDVLLFRPCWRGPPACQHVGVHVHHLQLLLQQLQLRLQLPMPPAELLPPLPQQRLRGQQRLCFRSGALLHVLEVKQSFFRDVGGEIAGGDGERVVLGEEAGEGAGEVDEVVVGEEPRAEVRNGDSAAGVHQRVAALDGGAGREGEEDGRRLAGVGFEEPHSDVDAGGGGGGEGERALCAEEVGASAIVVGEVAGGEAEGGEGVGEGGEVVVDGPPGVVGVGKGGGATVGEGLGEELVHRRRRRRPLRSTTHGHEPIDRVTREDIY